MEYKKEKLSIGCQSSSNEIDFVVLYVCIWNGQTNIADRDDRADASIGLSTGGYFAGGKYGNRSPCSLQYWRNNSFVVFKIRDRLQ